MPRTGEPCAELPAPPPAGLGAASGLQGAHGGGPPKPYGPLPAPRTLHPANGCASFIHSKAGHRFRWFLQVVAAIVSVEAAPAPDTGATGTLNCVVKESWRRPRRLHRGGARAQPRWRRRRRRPRFSHDAVEGAGRPRVRCRGCLDTMAATTCSNHRQPCPALLMWPQGAEAYVSEQQHTEGRPLPTHTECQARFALYSHSAPWAP